MINIYEKAEVGKSLAGLKLGENLIKFLPSVDRLVNGNTIPWSVNMEHDNKGVLLYVLPENNGFIIYVKKPKFELGFTEKGNLCSITAGNGFLGDIFDGGVKIGSKISQINHELYLDDTEDVHYLIEGDDIIKGILFYAGGLELDEDPNAIIEEVKVFDFDID